MVKKLDISPLRLGTWQGCPPSPFPFKHSVEYPTHSNQTIIRNKDIQIWKQEVKVSQLADDHKDSTIKLLE